MAPTITVTTDSDSDIGTPAPLERNLRITEMLEDDWTMGTVSEVYVKGSNLHGENFSGITEYVTVEFENYKKKSLNLFMKRMPENESYRESLEELQVYQKETAFFMEYLPMAREYCEAMGQEELLNIYPKCYYGDDEMIVLENLVTDKGFVMLDKDERQDFETAKIVLSSIAKHHAISHAMIQHLGGPTPFFERFPQLNFEQLLLERTRGILSPSMENSIDINIKILKKCGIKGADKAIATLESFKGKAYDKILDSLESRVGDFRVINHGDYWNNNMMFLKDNQTGEIIDQVIIDFQTLRYASPCMELSRYLFTSVNQRVLHLQLRELLEVYFETLKSVAENLGHPIHISFQELEADFCNHFHYGYYLGLASTTRANSEVMKNLNLSLSEYQDLGKLLEKLGKLVGEWVDVNPEKCAEDTGNIIEYVEYYDRFTTGKIA